MDLLAVVAPASCSRTDASPAMRASCPSSKTWTSGSSAGVTMRKMSLTGSSRFGIEDDARTSSGRTPRSDPASPGTGREASRLRARRRCGSRAREPERARRRRRPAAGGPAESPPPSPRWPPSPAARARSRTTPPRATASFSETWPRRGYSSSIRPTTCSRMSSIVKSPTGGRLPRRGTPSRLRPEAVAASARSRSSGATERSGRTRAVHAAPSFSPPTRSFTRR